MPKQCSSASIPLVGTLLNMCTHPSPFRGRRNGFGSSPRIGGMPSQNRLAQSLRLPTVTTQEVLLASRTKRVYSNAHTYHINSISVNSDQETVRWGCWPLGGVAGCCRQLLSRVAS